MASSFNDRILEYCTPSSRCRPEQCIHISTPRLTDSHSGSCELQSQHLSLPGSALILVIMRLTSCRVSPDEVGEEGTFLSVLDEEAEG